MILSDVLLDVKVCSHPVVRLDGFWDDFEGSDRIPSFTCRVPDELGYKDHCCGGSFVPVVYGGAIAFEQYKLLGRFEGKEYYYKDPKENMNPMRMPV